MIKRIIILIILIASYLYSNCLEILDGYIPFCSASGHPLFLKIKNGFFTRFLFDEIECTNDDDLRESVELQYDHFIKGKVRLQYYNGGDWIDVEIPIIKNEQIHFFNKKGVHIATSLLENACFKSEFHCTGNGKGGYKGLTNVITKCNGGKY